MAYKGRITETAPILGWMLHKRTREVWAWIKAKGYTVDVMDDPVKPELVPDCHCYWKGGELKWRWK